MIIVLIGPPGSGKGTQGIFLSKKLKLPHVSIGEVFRNKAKTNDSDAKELNKYMQVGNLAPSELVNRIVADVLKDSKYDHGCILDGYPRNIEQAKYLDNFTKHKVHAICLTVSDNTAIDRILNRYSCTQCKAIYSNLMNDGQNVCNNCGSNKFTHRKDDNLETARNRIEVYRRETEPIINHYKNNNNLILINANQNIKEVESELILALKKV